MLNRKTKDNHKHFLTFSKTYIKKIEFFLLVLKKSFFFEKKDIWSIRKILSLEIFFGFYIKVLKKVQVFML